MALTNQGENIEAIARYFGQVRLRTAAAAAIVDEWQAFWSGLSDYAKNFDQNAYDRARNLRLKFDRANAVTAEEREAVERKAKTGLSSEQIAGDPDRRTSTGGYIPAPSHGTIVSQVAWGAGLVIGGLVLLKLLK